MTRDGLTVLIALVLVSCPAAANAGPPGSPASASQTIGGSAGGLWELPDVIPITPGVRDPVFSVLIGLVESESFGNLTRDRLYEEIDRLGRPTKLPVEYLELIRRVPHPGRPHAQVRLVSPDGLDVPAPYRIIVYHPGRLWATPVVEFEEWYLGTISVEDPWHRNEGAPVVLEDVRLWGLRRGRLELDVDGWVDALLGSKLDDTRIVGFALFRHQGQLVGLAMGYNKEGKGRSGSFSFRDDRVNFPNPASYQIAAIYLRATLERLMPNLALYRSGLRG